MVGFELGLLVRGHEIILCSYIRVMCVMQVSPSLLFISSVDCSPRNGSLESYTSTTEGSEVFYSCDPGLVQEGRMRTENSVELKGSGHRQIAPYKTNQRPKLCSN